VTRKDKRFASIKRNPKTVAPDDLILVLESLGFEVHNYSGGSHYSVSHPQYPVLGNMEPNSIPMKRPYVKEVYVKRAIKWMEAVVRKEAGDEEEN